MESASRRRQPSRVAVLIVLGCAAIAISVAWQLLNRGSGDKPAASSTPTASLAVPPTATAPTPAGSGSAMPVFQSRRDPSDDVPPALLRVARKLAVGGTSAHGKLTLSRRVADVGGVSYYVWPAGKGLCAGLSDGTAARCIDVLPAEGDVIPTLVVSSGARRYVAGVVGSGATALTVAAPGFECSVHPERSGFLCSGPASSKGTIQATVHLRSGSTVSLSIG